MDPAFGGNDINMSFVGQVDDATRSVNFDEYTMSDFVYSAQEGHEKTAGQPLTAAHGNNLSEPSVGVVPSQFAPELIAGFGMPSSPLPMSLDGLTDNSYAPAVPDTSAAPEQCDFSLIEPAGDDFNDFLRYYDAEVAALGQRQINEASQPPQPSDVEMRTAFPIVQDGEVPQTSVDVHDERPEFHSLACTQRPDGLPASDLPSHGPNQPANPPFQPVTGVYPSRLGRTAHRGPERTLQLMIPVKISQPRYLSNQHLSPDAINQVAAQLSRQITAILTQQLSGAIQGFSGWWQQSSGRVQPLKRARNRAIPVADMHQGPLYSASSTEEEQQTLGLQTTNLRKGNEEALPQNIYQIRPEPFPFGRLNKRGQHIFQYGQNGVWFDDRTTYTAKQLREYVDTCPRDLTIWLQHAPAKLSMRNACGEKCRYRHCPSTRGTIKSGWFRVAFDEEPRLTSDGTKDPFLVAGCLHLWCFEQCFDVAELRSKGFLRPDTRKLPYEDRNPMALTRDHDVDIVEMAFKPWIRAHPAYIDDRSRRYENTLSYALNKHHLESQHGSKHKARKSRNQGKALKKSQDVHMGNLPYFSYLESIYLKKIPANTPYTEPPSVLWPSPIVERPRQQAGLLLQPRTRIARLQQPRYAMRQMQSPEPGTPYQSGFPWNADDEARCSIECLGDEDDLDADGEDVETSPVPVRRSARKRQQTGYTQSSTKRRRR